MLQDRFSGIDIKAYGCQKRNEAESFMAYLLTLGIDVHYKQTRQVAPGKYKGDWDLGIAIDIIEDDYDTVIIGSNDGDMLPIFEWCERNGKDMFVLGSLVSREITAPRIELKGVLK